MTEPPDFERLFRSTSRTAAHLEMRDDYGGSSPAFAAWRERRPYDRSGPDAAWHALVGSVTERGGTVRRARTIPQLYLIATPHLAGSELDRPQRHPREADDPPPEPMRLPVPDRLIKYPLDLPGAARATERPGRPPV